MGNLTLFHDSQLAAHWWHLVLFWGFLFVCLHSLHFNFLQMESLDQNPLHHHGTFWCRLLLDMVRGASLVRGVPQVSGKDDVKMGTSSLCHDR